MTNGDGNGIIRAKAYGGRCLRRTHRIEFEAGAEGGLRMHTRIMV
jgi:hypothetical protein